MRKPKISRTETEKYVREVALRLKAAQSCMIHRQYMAAGMCIQDLVKPTQAFIKKFDLNP